MSIAEVYPPTVPGKLNSACVTAGKKYLTDIIDALKDVPLVTANQLLDAWPDLALERSSNTPGEPPEGQSETSAPIVTTSLSSLVGISLGVAVQNAVR